MQLSSKSRVIGALFGINFVITFAFGMNDSLFSLYLSELNAEGLLIGLAFTFYSLSKIGFSPFAGKLLDRFGTLKVLSAGLFLYLLISVSFFAIKAPMYILALRIVQGAACALFRPVMHYVIGMQTEVDGRGKAFGIFDLSFYIALAAAPVSGGLIKEFSGFDSMFLVTGLSSIIAIILLYMIRNDLRAAGHNYSFDGSAVKVTGHALNAIYVFIFFKGWCVASVVLLLPLYMKSLGISESFIGFVLGSATAVMALSLPAAGYLADKFKKNLLIFSGGVLYYISIFFLFSTEELVGFFLVSVLCGLTGALSQPSCSALLIESAGRNELGRVIGRFNFIMGIGAACGAFVSSSFINHLDIVGNAVYFSGIPGIISSILFLFITSEKITVYQESPDTPKSI